MTIEQIVIKSVRLQAEAPHGPVCECDDWNCVASLGLSWYDYLLRDEQHPLISPQCSGTMRRPLVLVKKGAHA